MDSFETDSFVAPQISKRSGLEKNEYSQPKAEALKDPNAEAPSAFPYILGYDPYKPPSIHKHQNQRRNKFKKIKKEKDTPKSSLLASKIKPPPKRKEETRSKERNIQMKTASSNVPKLAYDLDSGKVYEEGSNTWYELVPINSKSKS